MARAKYVLLDVVGRGGGGTVFRARSLSRGEVAVKKLPGGEMAPRPLKELRHPHLVPVYDEFVEDGALFIVMQLARGTLRGRMDVLGQPMAPARAAHVVGQVAAGLRYLHDEGVLHLDVKPANVLLGEGDWPMLSDFGLAPTSKEGVPGTPAYMAPEQCLGRAVDARADQYALALVAFELLTGRRPYSAPTIEGLLELHVVAPIPPAGVSPAVDAVLARGMAKAPADRYESVTAFADALSAAIDQIQAQPAAPTPPAPAPTSSRFSRLRRLFRRSRPAQPPAADPDTQSGVEPLPVERAAPSAVGQDTTMTATRHVRALAARQQPRHQVH
jgi:serine/threonine protein kinase